MNFTPLSTRLKLPKARFDLYNNIKEMKDSLYASHVPNDLCAQINSQLDRFIFSLRYGGNLTQLDSIHRYIDWISKIPWEQKAVEKLDIAQAKHVLDKRHYGLAETKQYILEYLSTRILQRQSGIQTESQALLLTGLAGTGKTTFAKAIAEALGRPFVRIAFGGISSVLDLRGQSRLNPDAEPGSVIKSLIKARVSNPVILLDELDRIADSNKGQIMGHLLELLDPQQNDHYTDSYIDYPVDLSRVFFVATANNTENISTAVMDRLEQIQMPSYSDEEKIVIAKEYILPQLVHENGLASLKITITDDVWKQIARLTGFDPGIRSIERKVQMMIRRVAYRHLTKKDTTFMIDAKSLREYVA